MKLLLFILLIIGFVAFWITPVSFQQGSEPLLTGPMIQATSANGFTVAWRQSDPDAVVRVSYTLGHIPEQGERPIQQTRIGVESVCGELNRCTARIDGIQAGVPCHYQLDEFEGQAGQPVASGTVLLPPMRGEPFRFIAFGDSGSAEAGQRAVAERMAGYSPRVLVHTGDVVYPRGHYADYPQKFYRPYGKMIKDIPVFPTIGNHDYYYDHGASYLGEFTLPENGPEGTIPERHYYFDFGDVRFVCIDSNETFRALSNFVVPWMKRTLADADGRWTVVYFHHATFTHGKNAPLGSIRSVVIPAIDEMNVDLVLTGHNHMYERTLPMRNGEATADGTGTIYITTGAGGADLQPYAGPKPDFIVKDDNTVFSFTVVDVTAEALSFQQVTGDNEIIDRFAIVRTMPGTTESSAEAIEIVSPIGQETPAPSD
ncbi:MAG: metallophosphoesterase family protein [Phycisphaerae bacterium]